MRKQDKQEMVELCKFIRRVGLEIALGSANVDAHAKCARSTNLRVCLLFYTLIDIGARINNLLPLHRDSQIGSPSDSSRLARVVFEFVRVNLENIWLATFQHRPWAFTLANYSSAGVTDPFKRRAVRVRAKGTTAIAEKFSVKDSQVGGNF